MAQIFRKGHWKPPRRLGRRVLIEGWIEEENMAGDFARWLAARGGRPMERALIRARQRYEAQKPTRARVRHLHRLYRTKKA